MSTQTAHTLFGQRGLGRASRSSKRHQLMPVHQEGPNWLLERIRDTSSPKLVHSTLNHQIMLERGYYGARGTYPFPRRRRRLVRLPCFYNRKRSMDTRERKTMMTEPVRADITIRSAHRVWMSISVSGALVDCKVLLRLVNGGRRRKQLHAELSQTTSCSLSPLNCDSNSTIASSWNFKRAATGPQIMQLAARTAAWILQGRAVRLLRLTVSEQPRRRVSVGSPSEAAVRCSP